MKKFRNRKRRFEFSNMLEEYGDDRNEVFEQKRIKNVLQ